jgi:hypothetical protein
MNSKQNCIKIGLVLATLSLLLQALPAMADNSFSFKGKEIYVDSTPFAFQFPFASSLTTGQGRATHLGHYTVIGVTVINVTTATATGILRMIVDNGDILFVTMTGHALQPLSLKQTVADFTITGGTGRFEGATGSWQTISDFPNQVNAGVIPNPYVARITGTIFKAKHDNRDGDDADQD